jgi:uncharacterized protein (DUF1501 family)
MPLPRTLPRRAFLALPFGVAVAAALGAAGAANSRRFLFIHAQGGWDPLCVFAPLFGRAGIDMEPEAAPWTVGGLSLVDSPLRPQVRHFFETWHQRTLVLNGVSTRSVNHETCQAVALTGGTSDTRADFPTLLAAAQAETFRLPHVAFSGPVFPGEHTLLVSRATGLIQATVNGELLALADQPMLGLDDPTSRVTRDYLARRAQTFAQGRGSERSSAYLEAVRRAGGLSDDRYQIELEPKATVLSQAKSAIAALRDGVCRVATLGTGFLWDSHVDNADQTTQFEALFGDLDKVLAELAITPGPEGRPLSEDTLVVVSSEMGRTPGYNDTTGRDHWPFTTMLLIGDGLSADRVVGGFDDLYGGIGVDAASGEADADKRGIAAADVGATLLALGGVDPGEGIAGAEVLSGLLA